MSGFNDYPYSEPQRSRDKLCQIGQTMRTLEFLVPKCACIGCKRLSSIFLSHSFRFKFGENTLAPYFASPAAFSLNSSHLSTCSGDHCSVLLPLARFGCCRGESPPAALLFSAFLWTDDLLAVFPSSFGGCSGQGSDLYRLFSPF